MVQIIKVSIKVPSIAIVPCLTGLLVAAAAWAMGAEPKPDSLEKINFMAFQDCTSFTTITIPANVSLIDDQAFYRCTNLSKVIFKGDVEEIGETAFEEATNVVFVCKSGSNAEAFAQTMGIAVEIIE